MTTLPTEELAWAREWIAANRWKFASTMASIPHWYNVLDWHADGAAQRDWWRMCDMLVNYGWIENFYARVNAYLIVDEFKYWRIGGCLNRCEAPGTVYGAQWASRTRTNRAPTRWDTMALRWDQGVEGALGLWNAATDEVWVRDWLIRHVRGSVLDVGCGTGRLLDLCEVSPSDYLGLDPSSGMLNVHVMRHPRHRVEPTTLAEWTGTDTFDTVTALFGTASELTDAEIAKADALATNNLLLMYDAFGTRPSEIALAGREPIRVGGWSILPRSRLTPDAPELDSGAS